jgi:hypothetical protein
MKSHGYETIRHLVEHHPAPIQSFMPDPQGWRWGEAVIEGQPLNWSQLMEAAQSGDCQAYARLLHDILPDIRLIALKHHHADRAEPVVRDILQTLHRLRHTYDPARPFANWLAAISKQRALAAVRKAA